MKLFRSEVAERRSRLSGAVVLRQPNGHGLVAVLLAGFVLAASIWVALGTYARVETVPGLLTTDRPTAKVYTPRPGTAMQVLVSDGDIVKAGQPIVLVNADLRDSRGASAAADSAASVDAQIVLQNSQLELVRLGHTIERSKLTSTLTSLREQVHLTEESLALQDEIVNSQSAALEQIAGVAEKGFVSRNEFERRRQTLLAATQQRLQMQQQLASLQRQIAETENQVRTLDVMREREIASLQSTGRALEQQRIQFEGAHAFAVVAPIAGRVTALQVGVGQQVQPTVPLMIVVPADAQLQAEVYAPTRAIGLVKVGQESRLAFDAFPYQRFGVTVGRVERISGSVLDPRETGTPLAFEEPVYRITIGLRDQAVRAGGESYPLQPGMTLKANLILERQSFLDWLLAPLNSVRRKTGE